MTAIATRPASWAAALLLSAPLLAAPAGEITAPPDGSCHGAGDLPVAVEDSFGESPELTRNYLPRGGIQEWQPPPGDSAGSLGAAVALEGDRLAVGVAGQNGAVYLLRRLGEDWQLEQTLPAQQPAGQLGAFGRALALDGATLAVGAPDINGGAVYVYRHDGASWQREATLIPPEPRPRDIGKALAIEGDVLAVGALEWVDEAIGTVHVYRRDSSGDWQREARLTADPPDHDDRFGEAVALHGGELYVGARQYGPGFYDWGAVFRYTHDGTEWRRTELIFPPDAIWDHHFGSSIALDDETLVIGAFHDDDQGIYSGSAYVYRSYGTPVWRLVDKLRAPGGGTFWQFGNAVAVEGERLAVAAWRADFDDGAIYLWNRGDPRWQFDRRILPIADTDFLGRSLAMDLPITVAGENGNVYIDGASPPSHYWLHGSYEVRLEARDPTGATLDRVEFAIDMRPPSVYLRRTGEIVLPSDVPASSLFLASDGDAATGDVVHERALWDDCLLFDGDTYGDGDGLLSDEVFHFDRDLFCEAILRCDLEGVDEPWVRVEARDCAGNTGTSRRQIPLFPALTREDCE